MGMRSQIAIAIIAKEKSVFEKVKQDFVQSDFYKDYTNIATEFLNMFQEKQKDAYHLMVIYENSIKWYGAIDLAWKVFSEVCNDFNLHWSFMRVGEDEYCDIEEENNYCRFSDHSDFLLPYEVFAVVRYICSFV
ncbi:MAG: hypothetical protein COY58_00365 [Gammaproteobacteria bacterium CG_4_10_14_0_8_um_filter_38_16]|nr:MAG: hypothetical protein COY58_00365 [Gammaproteobacteria bacterium CG_4_10_14_0_8_um_filter_38_16]PJA04211.1 MAG: hypothetical protein COX72_01165 [Gammaproteobacteria bacterium CG_4_10_14_0_2_um_filter_38_22]PJB11046.1 MAG: hypothetical protein CO120_01665 [Gammaproteobacteria bacterium CG_4_9_14_3_um_filter_38_9]